MHSFIIESCNAWQMSGNNNDKIYSIIIKINYNSNNSNTKKNRNNNE